MKYLKNQQFEEKKKDLKLIRHQQHTNLIEEQFSLLLKAISYCVECENDPCALLSFCLLWMSSKFENTISYSGRESNRNPMLQMESERAVVTL